MMKYTMYLLVAALFAGRPGITWAQDFYYFNDTTATLLTVDNKIVIQLDSNVSSSRIDGIFDAHPCLDRAVTPQQLHGGFYACGLRPGCNYMSAAPDLLADAAVNRALPVYYTVDSAEFMVTDLISVKFRPDISVDSCLALLRTAGLCFNDSCITIRGYWQARLEDSIKGSPLSIANGLHGVAGIEWALPTFHSNPRLFGTSTGDYYPNQYYLNNIRQSGGLTDVDIDVDSAWLVAIPNPLLKIAVMDAGIEPHAIDLPASRISTGCSVIGPGVPTNFAPGDTDGHGMAVTGIIAAAHNNAGISGVFGTCQIVPVRIFYANLIPTDYQLATAINFAAANANVVCCAWGWDDKAIHPEVQTAIRNAVDSTQHDTTCVFVFGAGNNGMYPPWPWIPFPANMPEVIAVGAMNDSGYRWLWSPRGSTLDVMAPTGDVNLQGDMWTTDRMGHDGWNSRVTGNYDISDVDYTKVMGGTSGACPQVTGIVAMVLARRPDLLGKRTHLIVQRIIDSSAVDWYTPGFDNEYGYGLANAYRALLSVIRGDFDNSGGIDTLDARGMERYCFRLGPPPTLDRRVSDTDGDGDADILDYLRTVAAVAGTPIPPCFRY